MSYTRPIVLSIAGFDPSGGAGVLCDIKTFEQHSCLGMAVLSSRTIQTAQECLSVDWYDLEMIKSSLEPLLKNYPVQWIKIGLIENIRTLLQLCQWIKSMDGNIRIIWDSVLSASSGLVFIRSWKTSDLVDLYSLLYLITPNVDEVKALTEIHHEMEAAESIARHCRVLLKGGHSKSHKGEDVLITEEGKQVIPSGVTTYHQKHGTGCILSSAITANLALGIPLSEACKEAKKYVEKVANSNQNKLAYHHDIP